MRPTVIASQFGGEFDARLRAARPGLEVLTLPRRLEWPLPPEATVLLATPFADAQRAEPEPRGWPWNLRWTQLVSIGFDRYPLWFLERPLVSTAHGASAEPISDYVLACVLRHALRLHERRVRDPAGWRMSSAPALAGSTVGLFGFGGIGRAIARKALALGLDVLALRRSERPLEMHGVRAAASLARLLAESDHLVLAAPATAETRHVIDASSLAGVRPGLHLLNVSRGALVDQDALRAALDDGRVGYASLDVTDPEPPPEGHWLYTHPRVHLTPHTSAIGPQVQEALLAKVLRGLQALDEGRAPADPVDLGRGY